MVRHGALSVLAMAALVSVAAAGPLDPPAGPVTDTGLPGGTNPPLKTLGQIEPRTAVQSLPGSATAMHVISQSGSYYLTGNIQGVSGKHGILIAAENVTLDLNGFAVVGVSGAGDGISTGAYYRNLHVRNGSVRGWPGNGVNAQGDNSILEDLRVSNCSLAGIFSGTSLGTIVRGCVVQDCAGCGISTGVGALVERCSVLYTLTTGSGPGITVADGSVVRDCSVRQVRGTGVLAGGDCHVISCLVSRGAADGINVGTRSTVRQCTVVGQTGNGIVINGAACVVMDNTLDSNAPGSTTAGGILTTQNNARIEGNALVGNGQGIRVTGIGNFIARNTARANQTNFNIGSSNAYGPIVSVALMGNMGNNPDGNAIHPWANFSH
ncbi:MAG: right-handed parallel beta-helix repeat-containing protein [Phycisphaeraceae bacterium]|nr:right-handed parallel beta-helix repeat-containing protein [Phycisphaeraceae bacterium]